MTLPTAGPLRYPDAFASSASENFSPARIIEVELTEPLPTITYDGQHHRAWILARLHSEPVGICVAPLSEEGICPDELGRALWRQLRKAIIKRFVAAGQAEPYSLTGAGLRADSEKWPFLRRRTVLLADAPFISVVVCTRDRPTQLKTCLQRLEQQDYPRFEVVVVDNAPTTDAARTLVEDRQDVGARFRYHVEPRAGLSWARNAGIAVAASDIIAFLDDDDEPDDHWLAGIANGFTGNTQVGCVTGLILPARLDTVAEELFEEMGGHRKGRGFEPETFRRSGPQSPLFPLPPIGTGANMAFRRQALVRIGGFDVALGAGTPTAAGEDTLAFTLTMLAGYEVAYEHSALMWHHHRQDMDSLNKQLHGYSVGLTAFYAALLRRRPLVLPALLKLLPAATRYLIETTMPTDISPDLSARLDRRHLPGLLMGPLAYVSSMYRQHRATFSKSSSPDTSEVR
jgi:O-antigen biosynthesis protein